MEFEIGQQWPNEAEAKVVEPLSSQIGRRSVAFKKLEQCDSRYVVFKDEEGTGADRFMTSKLRRCLERLGRFVDETWPGARLRVTEAWDENSEHGRGSLHYEGRAADITTSDLDRKKLSKLAGLAVKSGCGWVYYENATHVHVSVEP